MGHARATRRLMARYPDLAVEHIPWQRTDWMTVRLRNSDDYPHGDMVMAEVEGPDAHRWADHDGYIGGSSWETPRDMTGFAAMLCNHSGLVAELRAAGYDLDLSEYSEPIQSCDDADCEDPECPYRVHWDHDVGLPCGLHWPHGCDPEVSTEHDKLTCHKCKRMYGEQLTLPGVDHSVRTRD